MRQWWRDFSPFLPLFRAELKSMALGTFLGFLAVLAAVGLLSLSGWFLAATAFAGLFAATAKDFNFFLPSIGVRILAMTRTLARYGERLACHDATFRILANLRTWFYHRLEPLAPARLTAYGSGDILSRIVGDIDALDNLYLRVLSPILVAGAALLALIFFLARIDVGLALIAGAALGLAGWGVPLWAAKKGAASGRKLVRRHSRMRTRMVEGLQGLAELLVFNIKDRYFAEIMDDHDRMVAHQKKMAHFTGMSNAFMTLLSGAAVVGTLMIGVVLVGSKDLSGEILTLVTLAVMAVFEAFRPLPAAFQYLGHTRTSARRLTEIVAADPQVAFVSHTVAAPRGFDLYFDRVGFRYPDTGKWILRDFSLAIPAGSQVALTGPSGAGKSTLTHLLMRFWDPVEGEIRLGGRDIRSISASDLRRLLVLAAQPAHIFNGTIRSNLLVAAPEAQEEKLWKALSSACLADFANQLPDGLDSWVGEGGKELSGGQMQRLALARLFLRDAPVWVLDEPTEGLDPATESELMDALFASAQERTLIVVTHRKAVLKRFERIVRIGGQTQRK